MHIILLLKTEPQSYKVYKEVEYVSVDPEGGIYWIHREGRVSATEPMDVYCGLLVAHDDGEFRELVDRIDEIVESI